MTTEYKKPETGPATAIYTTTRGQIEHYDNAISQRVIWLTIGQSFFFGVYATLVSIKAPTPELLNRQQLLLTLLPFAALLAAVFTLFDVIATLIYMRKLRGYYEAAAVGDNCDSSYPPVYGRQIDRVFQHISPTLVPMVFIVTWVIMLLYAYHFL